MFTRGDTVHFALKKSFAFFSPYKLIYLSVSYFTAIFLFNPCIFGKT